MSGNGPIDAKLLKGLTFKTAEIRETKDENSGKPIKKSLPVERALKPADVLDWKDLGDTVVIVAKDGRKYRVEKEAGDAPKGKKGGDGGAS